MEGLSAGSVRLAHAQVRFALSNRGTVRASEAISLRFPEIDTQSWRVNKRLFRQQSRDNSREIGFLH